MRRSSAACRRVPAFAPAGRARAVGRRTARLRCAAGSALKPAMNSYPNPFNAETIVQFELPRSAESNLRIQRGRQRIRRLVGDDLPAGQHRVRWDGRDADGRTQRVASI